ncbi:hypothetical protein C0995_003465 [Termitomyces sp. Mi166|nr:hypothetical protein C0995_003465 [Termitomyces sp. Mi166\
MATHLHTKTPTKSLNGKTPYELCWDKTNQKVYQLYHVKFIERHKSLPLIHEQPQPNVELPIPTLQQLDDSAPTTHYDDDDVGPINVEFDPLRLPTQPDEYPRNREDTKYPRNREDTIPRRSGHICCPTEKAVSNKNLPPTRLEKAVEEAQESARRVKEMREERWMRATEPTDDVQPQAPTPTDSHEIDHD